MRGYFRGRPGPRFLGMGDCPSPSSVDGEPPEKWEATELAVGVCPWGDILPGAGGAACAEGGAGDDVSSSDCFKANRKEVMLVSFQGCCLQ